MHVYSAAYRVAALGNIATAPAHRRQGLGRAVTAAVCQSLLATVDVIGLNVLADNAAARRCYEGLGFTDVCEYDEVLLERRVGRRRKTAVRGFGARYLLGAERAHVLARQVIHGHAVGRAAGGQRGAQERRARARQQTLHQLRAPSAQAAAAATTQRQVGRERQLAAAAPFGHRVAEQGEAADLFEQEQHVHHAGAVQTVLEQQRAVPRRDGTERRPQRRHHEVERKDRHEAPQRRDLETRLVRRLGAPQQPRGQHGHGEARAPKAPGDAVAAGSAPVMNQRTASGGTTCVATRTPLCQRCRCRATSTMLPAQPEAGW